MPSQSTVSKVSLEKHQRGRYVRVSRDKQDEALQLEALQELNR